MSSLSANTSRTDEATEREMIVEVREAAEDAAQGIIRTSASLRAAMHYLLHDATPGTWADIANKAQLFAKVDYFRAFMHANVWGTEEHAAC